MEKVDLNLDPEILNWAATIPLPWLNFSWAIFIRNKEL